MSQAPGARRGRPRHVPTTSGADARGEILDAAARLFVEHGYAGTSTRMIAEEVGIRQASLYYHYATKDDLLEDLLSASVRPSLEALRRLSGASLGRRDAPSALYALALADVRTLCETRHNVGLLYQLPEVRTPRFDDFRAERDELRAAYASLGAAVTGARPGTASSERLGQILLQLVETVIQVRLERTPDAFDTRLIAECCLRVCGCSPEEIRQAAAAAADLLPEVAASSPTADRA